MNRISVIGTGYVGLVTGACLAEFGLNVLCMDTNEEKIERLSRGVIPIYEPGLEELVLKNIKTGRLGFTTSISDAVNHSSMIMIAVGTPAKQDGSADMQYVHAAACSIAENMNEYKVIVGKSTVPVGTGRIIKNTVQEILKKRGKEISFDMVSNPEFLREGAAVRDFMHPDRIVIGCESEKSKEVMQNIYRVLYLNNHPFIFTNLETAELIKYASNAFLATKITFINEMANLCEAVGGNVQQVAHGMGLDGRIGKYFLHAGPGYGGSCFPKDTNALVQIAKEHACSSKIVEAVIDANEYQKARMTQKILKRLGSLDNRTIAVLGIAFKPETDDIRDSPAIAVIKELVKNNAFVRVYDPAAMTNAREADLKGCDIYYAEDEYDAAAGAEALVILTEWNQNRSLDISRLRETMRSNYFFDFRNIYQRNDIESAGFIYEGVGK